MDRESGSGSFLIDWQVLFLGGGFHLDSWCIFYFIDWSFAPLTHAPPPLWLQIHCSHLPALIQVPGGLSLCHWSAATLMARHTPNHHQKTSAGTSLRKCPSTPPPQHLPPTPIYPSLHTYIHPPLRSPTPASHASALTSLINQGLSQSAVWAAVHFDHLLLLTLSTFLI